MQWELLISCFRIRIATGDELAEIETRLVIEDEPTKTSGVRVGFNGHQENSNELVEIGVHHVIIDEPTETSDVRVEFCEHHESVIELVGKELLRAIEDER